MTMIFKHFIRAGLTLALLFTLAQAALAQSNALPVYDYTVGSAGSAVGQFNAPNNIFVDSTHIYVVDNGNGRVQRLNLDGTGAVVVATLPGGANAHDILPVGVDRFWITDRANNRVLIYDSSAIPWSLSTQITTFTASPTTFNDPMGLAINPTDGTVYVTDRLEERVVVFNPDATFNRVIDISPSEANAIVFDTSGQAYFTDFPSNEGRRINTDDTVAPIGDFRLGNGTPGVIGQPSGIGIDRFDRIYVTDWVNDRVSIFDLSGTLLVQFGGLGSANNQFAQPREADILGDLVFVSDRDNNRIQVFGLPVCSVVAPTAIDENTLNTTIGVACNEYVRDVFSYEFGLTYDPLLSTDDTTFTLGDFFTGLVEDDPNGFTRTDAIDDANQQALFFGTLTGTAAPRNQTPSGPFTALTLAEADFDTGLVTSDQTVTVGFSSVNIAPNTAGPFDLMDDSAATIDILAEDAEITINNLVLALLDGTLRVESDAPVGAFTDVSTITATLDPGGPDELVLTQAGPEASNGFTFTLNDTFGSTAIGVQADMDRHLPCNANNQIAAVDGTNNVTLTITLLAGDVNNDNVIDSSVSDTNTDGGLIVSIYGQNNTAGDINGDGVVDIFDLVHVGRNLNATPSDCVVN